MEKKTIRIIVIVGIVVVTLLVIGVGLIIRGLNNAASSPANSLEQLAQQSTAQPQTVKVKVLVSNAIADYVQEIADRYNAEAHKVDGITIFIEIESADGLTVLSKFDRDLYPIMDVTVDAAGLSSAELDAYGTLPVAWIADNRYLTAMVNDVVKARYNKDVFLTDGVYRQKPVVLSTLVWVWFNSRNQVLLSQYGSIDWNAVQQAATVQGGWQELGGSADWGYPKPMIPRPDGNVVGLEVLVSMGGEYYNKNEIETGDIMNSDYQKFMLDIFKSVTDLGVGSSSAMDFALMGYSVGDGGLLLESDVLQNMDGLTSWNDTIKITYPKKIVWNDYPFSIWMGAETTAVQKNGALDFEKYLLEEANQELALKYGLRPANQAVKLDSSADSLFVKWRTSGFELVIPRADAMRTPSREVINTLLEWYRKNVLER